MADKFKGRKVITFEAIKELLNIPEEDSNIQITDIIRTDKDRIRDTFTVILTSNKETSFTKKVTEGSVIPEL